MRSFIFLALFFALVACAGVQVKRGSPDLREVEIPGRTGLYNVHRALINGRKTFIACRILPNCWASFEALNKDPLICEDPDQCVEFVIHR